MNILNKILNILFPEKCAGCGIVISSNAVLCPDCLQKFRNEANMTCSKCSMTASHCMCSKTKEVIHSSRFYVPKSDNITSHLILKAKNKKSEKISKLFAMEICSAISSELNGTSIKDWIVTYVPRNKDNYLKYGFDQGEILAKCVSDRMGCDFKSLFSRTESEMQKTLDTKNRIENAHESIHLNDELSDYIKRCNILIVDDITTTGATLSMASELADNCGALKVVLASSAKTNRR